jgi:four helix bundle protein
MHGAGETVAIRSHRDLIVWQRAIELTVSMYEITSSFPREEMFGLTSQMRRAAVSVASNIAEGYGRTSTGEYRQFLGIARSSNLELETQLLVARKLGFGDPKKLDQAEAMSSEVSRMLVSLMSKIS